MDVIDGSPLSCSPFLQLSVSAISISDIRGCRHCRCCIHTHIVLFHGFCHAIGAPQSFGFLRVRSNWCEMRLNYRALQINGLVLHEIVFSQALLLIFVQCSSTLSSASDGPHCTLHWQLSQETLPLRGAMSSRSDSGSLSLLSSYRKDIRNGSRDKKPKKLLPWIRSGRLAAKGFFRYVYW